MKSCILSFVFIVMIAVVYAQPPALTGKTVVIEGNAKKEIVSVKELRHIAEDAKKPKREIEAITEPKEELQLTATGIMVIR